MCTTFDPSFIGKELAIVFRTDSGEVDSDPLCQAWMHGRRVEAGFLAMETTQWQTRFLRTKSFWTDESWFLTYHHVLAQIGFFNGRKFVSIFLTYQRHQSITYY
jgi:hypothetical protein